MGENEASKASGADKVIGTIVTVAVLAGLGYAGDHEFNNGRLMTRAFEMKNGKPPTTPEACMAALPIRDRLARLVMIGVAGSELPSSAQEFKELGIGGALVLNEPANSSSIIEFKNRIGLSRPIIAADYEGGTRDEGGVQAIRKYGELPLAIAVPDRASPKQYRHKVHEHGDTLKKLGVDWVLGPNASIIPKQGDDPLPGRSFSPDPEVVSKYVEAAAAGWLDADLVPFVKGFGGVNPLNTNGEPMAVKYANTREANLAPFEHIKRNAKIAAKIGIEVSNSPQNGLTGDVPASASPKVVKSLLRSQLGFRNNISLTDSYNSPEIKKYNPVISQVAVEALKAGNTMVLIHEPNEGVSLAYQMKKYFERSEAAIKADPSFESVVNADVTKLLKFQGMSVCDLYNSKQ